MHDLRSANIDPNAVPGHLRSSVLPALRRIYLDEIQNPPPPPVQNEAEVSKLRAENAILRAYCETWKRRANLHSAVVYGVAKVARGQILSMRAEREQLEEKYQNLKRRYGDLECVVSRVLPCPVLILIQRFAPNQNSRVALINIDGWPAFEAKRWKAPQNRFG